MEKIVKKDGKVYLLNTFEAYGTVHEAWTYVCEDEEEKPIETNEEVNDSNEKPIEKQTRSKRKKEEDV